MSFVQIVEFRTSKVEEMKALGDEYREKMGDGGPNRVVVGADRDEPGRHFTIVFFESYEKAMENSNHPTTQELSGKMMELGDGPPTFYNLDVIDDRTLG